jgi:predicted  nucleic acid-binding Zn-ribbon protein
MGSTSKLDKRDSDLQSLTERVAEAEKKMQAKQAESPNTELVQRILRLEERNGQLEQKLAQAENGKPA